jgi:ribonuclease T1
VRAWFALLLATAMAIAACGLALPPADSATAPPTRPTAATEVPATPSADTDPDSGLPLVSLADLPPEAAETIGLVAAGGSFPYPQDGAVFENREGLLPEADRGHYHEYTVETPGSADRGARRIVVGNEGEWYWTDDHYATFRRIAP